MGEIPLMTDNGSFIINGTERVIVSQLHRSPGVFFEHDRGKTHSSGKLLFSARVIPYRGSWLDFEFDPKDFLFFRVDRRRKMPVTTLLKAIGLTERGHPQAVLPVRHVPSRREGIASSTSCPSACAARWRASTSSARTARSSSPRTSASPRATCASSSTRASSASRCRTNTSSAARSRPTSSTRRPARSSPRRTTSSPTSRCRSSLDAGIKDIQTIYTNDLDQGPFISQTLRTDDTPDQYAAKVAIYRMMRPGEPPTEEAVEALFHGLFFSEERYDLSAVGRMKFNRRIGRPELKGPATLTNEDIIAVIKILVDLRNGRGEIDDIDHLGNRRVRSVGELAENQFRSGLVRVERAVKERLGQAESDNLLPHDLINAKPICGGDQGVLRLVAAVAVHGPDEPAVRDHAQAPRLGAGPGRPHARARGLRSARRAPDALRPRVPDRDAGRPEHRPHQLARALRAHQRVRLPRDAVPAREQQQGHRPDRLPVGDRGRPVRDRAGEREDRQGRQARRRARVLPQQERVHAVDRGQGQLHGRRAVADRVGGGVAHPVPRARRREPRADGLQHAAPGGAVPAPREAARRHGRRAHGRGRLGHGGDGQARRQGRLHRRLAHRRARARHRDRGG